MISNKFCSELIDTTHKHVYILLQVIDFSKNLQNFEQTLSNNFKGIRVIASIIFEQFC